MTDDREMAPDAETGGVAPEFNARDLLWRVHQQTRITPGITAQLREDIADYLAHPATPQQADGQRGDGLLGWHWWTGGGDNPVFWVATEKMRRIENDDGELIGVVPEFSFGVRDAEEAMRYVGYLKDADAALTAAPSAGDALRKALASEVRELERPGGMHAYKGSIHAGNCMACKQLARLRTALESTEGAS